MAGDVVVLHRPWWARALGTGFWTLWVGLGPVLTLVGLIGLVTGNGETASVGLAGSVPFWIVMPAWSRVGVTVDATGVTVQNVIRRHHVAWSHLRALELAPSGQGDGRFAIARLLRSDGRPVDIGAIGMIGHRRRIAWVAAVTPVLLAHGVSVTASPAATALVWRGIDRPASADPAHWKVTRPVAAGRAPWVAVGILALIGVVLLVLGGVVMARDLDLRDHGVRVEARIVGEPDPGGPREDTDVPIVFTTEQGRDVRTSVTTTRSRVEDRTIAVRYDPGDPERVRAVAGPELPWRLPLIGGLMALGAAAAVGGTVLVSNRSARATPATEAAS